VEVPEISLGLALVLDAADSGMNKLVSPSKSFPFAFTAFNRALSSLFALALSPPFANISLAA
jgi:hypothetical protein